MQVFKAFLKTSMKYMPQTMLYFAIFSAIAFMISNSASGTDKSGFQAVELDIGIVDEDKSATSLALAEYLDGMHHVTSFAYGREVLLDRLFYRDLNYILVISDGFENRLLDGESEGLFETIQIPGTYSGVFVPQRLLGENVLAIAKFLPFYWYVENNDMVSGFFGEAFAIEAYWRNVGIQSLFAVMLFAVALAVAKLKNARQKE